VRLVLVRHASAGDRPEWEGDDRLRPLDKRGRKQAKRALRFHDRFRKGAVWLFEDGLERAQILA
jgi:8-oxo-(d)GTP phosphatase